MPVDSGVDSFGIVVEVDGSESSSTAAFRVGVSKSLEDVGTATIGTMGLAETGGDETTGEMLNGFRNVDGETLNLSEDADPCLKSGAVGNEGVEHDF